MSFESGMVMEEHDSEKVEIVLKTIGPARPSRLLVPSSIKVCDLRRLIARNENLQIYNLSLILRGSALYDTKNGDDVYIQLNDGDCLIVAVKPMPPVKDGYDNDDEDEDLKFRLPHSSSWWKKRLYSFLHDNLKLPVTSIWPLKHLQCFFWNIICMTIICLQGDKIKTGIIQYSFDGNFHSESEGMASHNFVVYPGSCCP
ncbi:hypothetical protein D0Y65_011996 [Glycine soja]|uniref:Ubiquitin-like domain-containing protein n=1 Tax=Glycine soja TaxID=3848 RepID=A0A445KM69_GLYSO|nr:hypothetical protein D0Y65_011996 [Glycine soja]